MSWSGFVAALKDRLEDVDDNVRIAVVKILCDLLISDLESVPTDLLHRVAEHLRDKRVHAQNLSVFSFYVSCCLKNSSSVVNI